MMRSRDLELKWGFKPNLQGTEMGMFSSNFYLLQSMWEKYRNKGIIIITINNNNNKY